jgi:hypothetical protein
MSATIATAATSAKSVSTEAITDLRTKIGNRLITPQDEAYDGARRVWNGMIDRKPAAIARCHGVADVIDCVRWAVAHDVLLAVRGGGHNVAGFGTCDGGLVIDLSPMNGIRVDRQQGTVRAGGGATWIAKRRRSVWPFPVASSPRRGSPVLRSAGVRVGCVAPTAWPVTA